VLASGATLLHARRLQHDVLLDSTEGTLRLRGCALRLRSDGGQVILTFKGAVQPGQMKVREEHQTAVADPAAIEAVLEGLGFHPWFRYEKYREEYTAPGVIIAIDETPVGTYVEIEGEEAAIVATAHALGRTEDDFIRRSYRTLFVEGGEAAGLSGPDMVFSGR
jgi:adenylate cyclase class 2